MFRTVPIPSIESFIYGDHHFCLFLRKMERQCVLIACKLEKKAVVVHESIIGILRVE